MRCKLILIRTTTVEVEFEHDGSLLSARLRVNENLDDFIHMGEIENDDIRIKSLKEA